MDFALVLAATALAISSAGSPAGWSGKGSDSGYFEANAVINGPTPSLTEEGKGYLSLFDNVEITKSNDGISFKGSKAVLELFRVEGVERREVMEQSISFDVCYLASLDLCVMEVALGLAGKDPAGSETVVAFPFVDEKGEKDVRCVLNGYELLRSDLMDGDLFKPSAEKGMAEALGHSGTFLSLASSAKAVSWETPKEWNERVDGAGLIAPIIGIIDCITGFDRAIGFANGHVKVPDISLHGIASYFLFAVRMKLLKDHFNHNSSLNFSGGYIFSQNALKDFRYSLFGNVADSGCGVVAAYNLLYDVAKGSDPIVRISLPTLIALFEALNADFLFGALGSSPIPHEYYLGLVVALNLLTPLIALLAPFLAEAIVHAAISNVQDPLAKAALVLTERYCVVLTAAGIVAALAIALATADALIEYFEAFKADPGFIVGLYVGSGHCTKRMLDYDGYENDLIPGARSIVAFWNVFDEATDLPDYLSGAHFLFVKNDEKLKRYLTYNDGNIIPSETENLFDLIGISVDGKFSRNVARRCIISSFTFNK